ncbi:putative sulfate exporter family transporter, partial [bacterium]
MWSMVAHAGVLLFVVLAAACLSGYVSPPVALAAGLLLALTLGNPFPAWSARWSRRLLQISVVGLGFGLDLPAVLEAGRLGFGFTVATICGTLALGLLLGRLLRIERDTSLLVSAGTAICGGSAIAAV